MKHRYPEMDGLRAAAALAVVVIHTSAGGTSPLLFACNQLARFAVPLFLMLSGFGHAGQPPAAGKRWADCRRRLGRILPAYFVWSAVYLAVDAAFGKPHAHPLRDLLLGGSYIHLYYLFVLTQFVLLSAWLIDAVRRKPAWTLAGAAVLSLAAQLLRELELLGCITLPETVLPFARWFMPWTIFYVAGAWLRQHSAWQRLSPLVTAPLWAASAALVLLTAKHFPAVGASSLRLDLTLYVFASWLLLWSVFRRLPALRAVRFVSRHSFGLYLAHPLVMRLWNEWVARRETAVYLGLWQRCAMAAAGGLAIAWALSLLPRGTYLGGAARNQEK